MLVKFKANLGSMDADRFGIDFKVCLVDAEVAVNDGAGKWLVATGVATDITPKPPEPVKEVEPEAASTDPQQEVEPEQKPVHKKRN